MLKAIVLVLYFMLATVVLVFILLTKYVYETL